MQHTKLMFYIPLSVASFLFYVSREIEISHSVVWEINETDRQKEADEEGTQKEGSFWSLYSAPDPSSHSPETCLSQSFLQSHCN